MIGDLKTNRVIFPCGIKQGIREFAFYISKQETNLVTVGSRKFYVYRYEGKLNGMVNAVVLISYPENAFHDPKALRAFVCTDVSLTTTEILDAYVERWSIELFFRQSKGKLALDKYQIRSSQGIHRYWLIMSFLHLISKNRSKRLPLISPVGILPQGSLHFNLCPILKGKTDIFLIKNCYILNQAVP